MVTAVAEFVEKFPENEAVDRMQALFEDARINAENFMPDDPGHDFLVEMVITATHYVNLLYNFGVFDDASSK